MLFNLVICFDWQGSIQNPSSGHKSLFVPKFSLSFCFLFVLLHNYNCFIIGTSYNCLKILCSSIFWWICRISTIHANCKNCILVLSQGNKPDSLREKLCPQLMYQSTQNTAALYKQQSIHTPGKIKSQIKLPQQTKIYIWMTYIPVKQTITIIITIIINRHCLANSLQTESNVSLLAHSFCKWSWQNPLDNPNVYKTLMENTELWALACWTSCLENVSWGQ